MTYLSDLKMILPDARAEVRKSVEDYVKLKEDSGDIVTNEEKATYDAEVTSLRGNLKPVEFFGVGQTYKEDASVGPLDERILGLSAKLTQLEGVLRDVVEREVFVDMAGTLDLFTKVSAGIKDFREAWRAQLRLDAIEQQDAQQPPNTEQGGDSTQEESGTPGGEDTPLDAQPQQEEEKVSPARAGTTRKINVKQILSQIGNLKNIKSRTDHISLSPEQRKERAKLEFNNPELDYTPEQWKERLDRYVELYHFLKRDGCYLGAIEHFLTPTQQDYMILLRMFCVETKIPENVRPTVMNTMLFIDIVQHLIDSKTTLEVSLEGSDLIQRARDKFANDKPWPSDSTKPVYFFYKLNKFLDQAGNRHLLSYTQVARAGVVL